VNFLQGSEKTENSNSEKEIESVVDALIEITEKLWSISSIKVKETA
jgi:hypothetical protein